MGKKEKKENLMQPTTLSSMFNETAGYETTQSQIEESKVQSPDKDYERFNFICSKDLASKARAISRKEGFTIRALMERAMKDFFVRYEEKNGEIGELISKDINDVL